LALARPFRPERHEAQQMMTKRQFMTKTTAGMGSCAFMIGALALGKYGAEIVFLLLVASFLGAYLWAVIMWRLMFGPLYERQAKVQLGDPPRRD
jgi:hypothetical protein